MVLVAVVEIGGVGVSRVWATGKQQVRVAKVDQGAGPGLLGPPKPRCGFEMTTGVWVMWLGGCV